MNLGVQYYRAPFPDPKHWEEDFRRIRSSGLNTVQLWISWGWVEASPDRFVYDDYDRLVDLAGKYRLGVVLSTIAEIQPNWIHRVIPNCELVDNCGNKIHSVARHEHHFGLTPGGCTDHPEVWKRMVRFLETTGRRYAGADHLRGWDVWNELRWNVHANAPVCYCPHTIAAFRDWLRGKFGSLEGLNEAWKRRYDSWEDVDPGREHDLPYTEMIAFEEFITHRADEHGARRYQVLKAINPDHPVTAHAANPCPLMGGAPTEFAINRGNDWALAEALDGIGCSSFPQWGKIDDADFGMRIDMVRSAARDKTIWLSELQGGRASIANEIFDNVEPESQQRWLWNGVGSGAGTILFWCWRDEVFGRESAGFGLNGADGLAEKRLAAMRISGELLQEHAELFDHYRPMTPEVGLYFSPRSYYLGWAQEGNARRMSNGLTGYARALTRRSIPCRFIESDRTEALANCRILFLPRVPVLSPAEEETLTRFVEQGGTLFCESETGAFTPEGFYRYPEERFLTRFGMTEIGRRPLQDEILVCRFRGREYRLRGSQWLTPMEGAAPGELLTEQSFGAGKVICFCGYLGNAYRANPDSDFETLLEDLTADAGVRPEIAVEAPRPDPKRFLYLKFGRSKEHDLAFVFFPAGWERAELRLSERLARSGRIVELFSGREITPGADGMLTVTPGKFRIALLAFGA